MNLTIEKTKISSHEMGELMKIVKHIDMRKVNILKGYSVLDVRLSELYSIIGK